MATFHKLIILSVQRLTSDSIAITFSIPDKLQTNFQFQHGQFVQLRTEIQDEQVERAYSICTAPYERKITVAIKHVDQGVFSQYANTQFSEGLEIEVSEPQGVFTHQLDSSQKKNYLLVAAGSGITPILSIVKMTLASETLSHCTLVYANKTPESSMFYDELHALVEKYSERLNIIFVYSNSDAGDFQGRINAQVLPDLVADFDTFDESFICGPEKMSLELREWMIEKGMSIDLIHIELFEVSKKFTDSGFADSGNGKLNKQAQISVMIDGEVIEFIHDDPTRSILDIALDYDSDLPYGCQNGSCGSCQCKVISGSVEMEVNYALSQSELDEGFVLLCQSRPTSKKVEVDYDA